MTDKEELKALLKSYKESPSRGIKGRALKTARKIFTKARRLKRFT